MTEAERMALVALRKLETVVKDDLWQRNPYAWMSFDKLLGIDVTNNFNEQLQKIMEASIRDAVEYGAHVCLTDDKKLDIGKICKGRSHCVTLSDCTGKVSIGSIHTHPNNVPGDSFGDLHTAIKGSAEYWEDEMDASIERRRKDFTIRTIEEAESAEEAMKFFPPELKPFHCNMVQWRDKSSDAPKSATLNCLVLKDNIPHYNELKAALISSSSPSVEWDDPAEWGMPDYNKKLFDIVEIPMLSVEAYKEATDNPRHYSEVKENSWRNDLSSIWGEFLVKEILTEKIDYARAKVNETLIGLTSSLEFGEMREIERKLDNVKETYDKKSIDSFASNQIHNLIYAWWSFYKGLGKAVALDETRYIASPRYQDSVCSMPIISADRKMQAQLKLVKLAAETVYNFASKIGIGSPFGPSGLRAGGRPVTEQDRADAKDIEMKMDEIYAGYKKASDAMSEYIIMTGEVCMTSEKPADSNRSWKTTAYPLSTRKTGVTWVQSNEK